MVPIPWFYMWSPKYEIFHRILEGCLVDCSGFSISPQFYPQSFFEVKPDQDTSLFGGNPIKFQMLMDKLANLEEGARFILSDADIMVLYPNQFAELCAKYLEYDIVGMWEFYEQTDFMNIGLLLCKNTALVREFFQHLINTVKGCKETDQDIFNRELKKWQPALRATGFPSDLVAQSNFVAAVKNQDNLYVVQALSSISSSDDAIVEKLVTFAGKYDLRDLLYLIPIHLIVKLVNNVKGNPQMQDNPLCTVKFILPTEEVKKLSEEEITKLHSFFSN